MPDLVFATSNKNKIAEAQEILGFKIQGTTLDIPEIQSLDPKEVIIHKAVEYYKIVQKPLIVEDNSLLFEALNGLPGTYINDFLKALGNDGLINLLKNQPNRRAESLVIVGYIKTTDKVEIFTGSVSGSIAYKQTGFQGFGWDPIFIPDGDTRTFGEMSMEEKNNYSMRTIALRKFKSWLDTKTE